MKTLLLVKPNATQINKIGKILSMVEDAGFKIIGLKMLQMTPKLAAEFYLIHKDKPFYEPLIAFMTSGNIVAAILEKEDAVACLRQTVGATNPAEAKKGTIRKLFGKNVEQNAVHASDSPENALLEISIIFR